MTHTCHAKNRQSQARTKGIAAVSAYRVTASNWEHESIINARSASQARYQHWRDISDVCPDLAFTAVRSRKLGGPHTSSDFLRTAQYRGLPHVRCGDRVRVGHSIGTIIGANASANFDVLFDPDDAEWPGLTLNVHPGECAFLPIGKPNTSDPSDPTEMSEGAPQ